jgi:undecaprenyl diphosphate synthase
VGIYDRLLEARVRASDAENPRSVALVITERDLLEQGAYDTLADLFRWAVAFGAERIAVYVSVLDEAVVPTLANELRAVTAPREVAVRGPDDDTPVDAPILVSIGLGGKAEFAGAVRRLAGAVDRGEMAAAEIDEAALEDRLTFPPAPDLLSQTGAERLSDFQIWQSGYSELYFTDVNWRDFRRRDYLRAIRDYHERQRRFGE